MSDNPYPLPKSFRETDILAGDGRSPATWGPFDFKIFDAADVVVMRRAAGSNDLFAEDEAVTVTKTAGLAQDTFSITFATVITSAVEFYVASRRLHERTGSVTRGGAVHSTPLERELSLLTQVAQELRRDVNRAVSVDPDHPPVRIRMPEEEGRFLVTDGSGNLVDGGSAGDIADAEGYAEQAAQSASAAAVSAGQALTAAALIPSSNAILTMAYFGGRGDLSPTDQPKLQEALQSGRVVALRGTHGTQFLVTGTLTQSVGGGFIADSKWESQLAVGPTFSGPVINIDPEASARGRNGYMHRDYRIGPTGGLGNNSIVGIKLSLTEADPLQPTKFLNKCIIDNLLIEKLSTTHERAIWLANNEVDGAQALRISRTLMHGAAWMELVGDNFQFCDNGVRSDSYGLIATFAAGASCAGILDNNFTGTYGVALRGTGGVRLRTLDFHRNQFEATTWPYAGEFGAVLYLENVTGARLTTNNFGAEFTGNALRLVNCDAIDLQTNTMTIKRTGGENIYHIWAHECTRLNVDASNSYIDIHSGGTDLVPRVAIGASSPSAAPVNFALTHINTGIMPDQYTGLTLSNNAANPNTHLDISPGVMRFQGRDAVNPSVMVKRLNATWAKGTGNGGLDTGTSTPGATYHARVIRQNFTGEFDVLLSTSLSSPVVPSGWTALDRIGSIKTNGSGAIRAFVQHDKFFGLIGTITTITDTTTRAQALHTIGEVPTGISVQAVLGGTVTGTLTVAGLVRMKVDDGATSGLSEVLQARGGATDVGTTAPLRAYTNTNGQIWLTVDVPTGTASAVGYTLNIRGWVDTSLRKVG